MTIGAYYCCFDQPAAAHHMLSAFRAASPTSTVVLVNDAGDPVHERIAKKHDVTHYVSDAINIGFPGRCDTVDPIVAWIARMASHLDKFVEPWFTLLEDDVLVLRPVREQQLVFDVNGISWNAVLPSAITSDLIQRTRNGANVVANLREGRVAYGAMGGSIFRTEFFRRILATNDWQDDLRRFQALAPSEPSGQTWPFSDTCLSYLTYLNGGTIGAYADFAELWMPGVEAKMATKDVAVVNQYKHHYGVAFDESVLA